MKSDRIKLIEHFINKCSMAIEEANKVAEMNERLRNEMKVRNVKFLFKKKDGTLREAIGTLKSDILPEIKGTGRPLNFDLQIYYDIEKKSFRSFKKSNLISYD